MEATTAFSSAELPAAQTWASGQLADWGVSTDHVVRWLRRSAELLGPERLGRVVLCYDPDDRLVSIDVYCDGQRVFGMDDWV